MIDIKISEDALQDLNDRFLFYEAQEAALGQWVWKSLKRFRARGTGFTQLKLGVNEKFSRAFARHTSCDRNHTTFRAESEGIIKLLGSPFAAGMLATK